MAAAAAAMDDVVWIGCDDGVDGWWFLSDVVWWRGGAVCKFGGTS